MKKRVLVIGAGRRAHCVVFPALWCLSDLVEVVSIHTRTLRRIELFSSWSYTTIQDLSSTDFASIDLIILAVPPEQVAAVVTSLNTFSVHNCILIIDTPVFPLHRIGTLSLLSKFKRVVVAEDLIGFPTFVLARKLIDEGLLGTVKHIELFHSGFKYHALATLSWVLRSGTVLYIRSKKICNEIRVKTMRFAGGGTVHMLEPRDYEVGRWFIAGTKGSLSDYPIRYAHAHVIGYVHERGRFSGLTLDGETVKDSPLDVMYKKNIHTTSYEVSLTNDLKIRGYMELVMAAFEDNSPFHYRPLQGIYDTLAIKVADKLGLFLDIGTQSKSLIRYIISVTARLMRQ